MRRRLQPAVAEKGASAILVAGAIFLLMGMAAIALDLSALLNERRTDQTAADLGAVAGAISFTSGDAATRAVAEVTDVIRANLDTQYSDAEWRQLWRSCTDPDRPAGFTSFKEPSLWGGSSDIACISASWDEIRVRVPQQIIETSFGRVLGVEELATFAVAHAEIGIDTGGKGRPFGLLANIAAGHTCILEPPGGHGVAPCGGPNSGNFGTLSSQQWGNQEMGTLTDCTNPGEGELATTIALGFDHPVGVAKSPAASSLVLDRCTVVGGEGVPLDTDPRNTLPNYIPTQTGNNFAKAVRNALFDGSGGDFANVSTLPMPIMRRVSEPGVKSVVEMQAKSDKWPVDNTPLWMHLRPWSEVAKVFKVDAANDTTGPHKYCNRNRYENKNFSSDAPTDGHRPSWAMDECLKDYEAAFPGGDGPPIFEDTLDQNPRFAFVPQFWSSTWPSGSSTPMAIRSYRIVYLNGFFFNCNGSKDADIDTPVTTCDNKKGDIWYPSGNNSDNVKINKFRLDQVTSFLLPRGAAPDTIEKRFPWGVAGPFVFGITR